MLPRSCPRPRATRGLTLIETVISLSLFTLVSLGILAVVAQTRRMAEASVYENTALTMAQGYIEQLRSVAYDDLINAALDDDRAIVLRGALGDTLTDTSGGALNPGDWARETVMLDRNEAGTETQPMPFRFRVDLSPLGGGVVANEGVEIILTYETDLPLFKQTTLRRTLRTVRSVVPTY